MNLQDMTLSGTNSINVSDSLNASLLKLIVKRGATTIAPDGNSLIVYVDKASSANPTSERKQYVFDLASALQYYNEVSDEFKLQIDVKNNDICFKASVERKIAYENSTYSVLETPTIELLESSPIVLFEGENYIYTNYENADLNIIYPKNTDENRMYLNSAIYAGHRLNASGDFSLDDIYFKDAFTKTGDKLNLEVNNAKVDCITSNKNNFSLDENGNLIVKNITGVNSLNISTITSNDGKFTLDASGNLTLASALNVNNITSKNSKFSLDANGNLSLNGNVGANTLNINNITSKNSKFSLDANGNLSVKGLTVNGQTITSGGGLSTTEVCNLIYPVGSIYMSINSTNPANLFGGTWSLWGSGRVPVCINTSDTDFSTVEKTGGSKTHTHTSAAHTHNLSGANAYALVNYTGGRSYLKGRTRSSWTPTDALTGTSTYSSKPSNTWSADVAGKTESTTPGNTGSSSNMPPYITCYMWKRTS